MSVITTIKKTANEVFKVECFYFPPDLNDGETISSAATSADTGITVGSTSISGNSISFQVSGGTAGNEYTIGLKATMSSGLIREIWVQIKVKEGRSY